MAQPPPKTLTSAEVFGPARLWLWIFGSALLACGGSIGLLALLAEWVPTPSLVALEEALTRYPSVPSALALCAAFSAVSFLAARGRCPRRLKSFADASLWLFCLCLGVAWYSSVLVGQRLLLEAFGGPLGLIALPDAGWRVAQVLAPAIGLACFVLWWRREARFRSG